MIYMKPLTVRFEKEGFRVYTIINSVSYGITELAELLQIQTNTVRSAFARYSDEEKIDWIHKKKWLLNNGFAAHQSVFKRDNNYTTTQAIMAETGLATAGAFERGNKWQRKQIKKNDVYVEAKNKLQFAKQGKADWKGFSNNPSTKKPIEDIPSPTKFDKEVYGQHIGDCLPGLANNIHSRY